VVLGQASLPTENNKYGGLCKGMQASFSSSHLQQLIPT
jgi:hypothetical protein